MWPFNKKKDPVRNARAYQGAAFNRLVADWVTASTSVDAEIRGSIKKLRDRTRQLARDNDYVKNFFRALENNVIGQGIPFQSQVLLQRGNKLDEKTNDLIEEKFKRWTRKEFCHVAGQLSWEDIQRLAIRETGEAGDFFVRKIRQSFGGSKIPFALELIEADLLDDNLNDVARGTGNEIRMGVERDKWSRPVAYWFFAKHPGDGFHEAMRSESKHIRVPADEIIPLFISERAGQTRGVPWIAASIVRLHHMQGYQEAEVISARASASLMGFIETAEGELKGDDVQDGDRVTDFEPGVFKKLNPGEKVNVPDLKHDSSSYDPFMRSMLRGVAAGVGASYETLSRDYSQSNYSSSRLALIDDRDNWRAIQAWMIRNFHQQVFEGWLEMAVLSGELNLPNYHTNPERYTAVKWMPRGWAWVDPQKEANAYLSLIKGGLATQTNVLAMEGEDFEEFMMQRKREVDRAKQLGLTFDSDAANDKPPAPSGSGPASPKDTE